MSKRLDNRELVHLYESMVSGEVLGGSDGEYAGDDNRIPYIMGGIMRRSGMSKKSKKRQKRRLKNRKKGK